jgi:hypothetical protein
MRLALRFPDQERSPNDDANQTASNWWTGKDSNLRSPQGAADLQSAGFSHSPTRPAKTPRRQDANCLSPQNLSCKSPAVRKKHKKDSCQKTPARLFFPQGFAPPHSPADQQKTFWWSWRRELNPRPSDYKSDALPAELRQRRSNQVRIAEGASKLQGAKGNQSNSRAKSVENEFPCVALLVELSSTTSIA